MRSALDGLRRVSAAALVESAFNGDPAGGGPQVLRLDNALVVGFFDLSFLRIGVSLQFVNCAFTDTIGLVRAQIPNLSMTDCRVLNVAGPSNRCRWSEGGR